MIDEKESLINSVSVKMNLETENDQRLRNLLWMEMQPYSLIKINETEIQVRDTTLNEHALKMFFVAKAVQGCTPRTIKYYRSTLKEFFEFMGHKPIDQITSNDIRFFLAVKKERDKNSDTTINNIRRNLSSFFAWCLEEEYIAKNPLVKIKKIRQEKLVKKPFTDVDLEKFRYEMAKDLRLTAIVEVMLSTGCRISEVEMMNKKDLEGDEIVVYGKGKKERVVYLNAKAQMALRRYLETRTDDNEALFVSKDRPHDRLLKSQIGAQIRKMGKKCGVKDTHPHRFRRTAATLALNRGMPIDQVQLMLGHENIETTTLYAISAQEAVKANHKKYVV